MQTETTTVVNATTCDYTHTRPGFIWNANAEIRCPGCNPTTPNFSAAPFYMSEIVSHFEVKPRDCEDRCLLPDGHDGACDVIPRDEWPGSRSLEISATAVSIILLRDGARFELTVHEAARLLTFLRDRPLLVRAES